MRMIGRFARNPLQNPERNGIRSGSRIRRESVTVSRPGEPQQVLDVVGRDPVADRRPRLQAQQLERARAPAAELALRVDHDPGLAVDCRATV